MYVNVDMLVEAWEGDFVSSLLFPPLLFQMVLSHKSHRSRLHLQQNATSTVEVLRFLWMKVTLLFSRVPDDLSETR